MDQTFGIFIKSQADLDALNLSEEHTKRLADELKKAGQAAQQSGKAQEQAAQQTTNAFQKTTSATKVLTNEKLGLQRAAGAVATSLTGLGAAGSIASNALLAVATGAGAAGVVIGVVSTVITFLIQRMNEATEKKKSLDAAMRSGDLGFFSREISEADQKLIGLTQRVDALRARVQTRTGSTFFGATGVAGAQRELAEAEAERAGLVGERQKILGEKVGAATLALQFQTQAIGANVTQQQELEHELRVIAALQGGLKDATQAAKDAFIGQSAALRDRSIGEALRKEREEQTKKLLQEAQANDAARESIVGQISAVREQQTALTDGAEAAALYSIANLSASDAVKKLGEEGAYLLTVLRDEKLALIALNQENERRVLLGKSLADSAAAQDKQKQDELDDLQKELSLKQQLNNFELDKLRAAGAPESMLVQRQIELLREQKQALENSPVAKEPGQILAIQNQIELAQISLYKLQNTGIDVAGEIGRVVTDITGAVITGTLKWVDIGRSALASVVRVGLESFTNMLRQMSAQQSFVATATANNMSMPSGGGGGGGGGGLMQSIGNMFGGGGGGGGGFNLGSLFSGGGAGFGFGSGAAQNAAGVAGPSMANGGFFSGGMAGGAVNGLTGILDSGGGMVASLFGGMMTGGSGGKLGVGGQILGSLASSAMMSGISIGLGGTGGLMGGLVTAITGAAMVPVIGWIVAAIAAVVLAITSIFGAQKPNPSVLVKSKIDGFFYSELENQFKAGSVVSKARGTGGIPDSAVSSTKTAVQQLLEGLSKQWTEILNMFPVIVHDQMIPSLEAANKLLNRFFGDLKISEGGSRTIQEEITRLGVRTGPEGFFHALRGTIGAGLTATIKQAGLGDLSELVNKSFAESDPNSTFASIRSGPGLKAPQGVADVQPFFEAVGKFVSLTSGLGSISKSGIGSFLTEQDMARTTSQFSDVLKITDGKQFTSAVDLLEEKLKPVMDFLQQSVQQTTQLFGRGMIAALDAVSESGAIAAFNRNLGTGVKDMIFAGITEAFIASAQFNDLLAPIQKTIREFTQQAINTGQTPDIDAFRRAILPNIEEISSRAETLAPLIAELQKLGFDVKDALKALTGSSGGKSLVINFNGPVSMENEQDAADLLRQIDAHLEGQLPAH